MRTRAAADSVAFFNEARESLPELLAEALIQAGVDPGKHLSLSDAFDRNLHLLPASFAASKAAVHRVLRMFRASESKVVGSNPEALSTSEMEQLIADHRADIDVFIDLMNKR